jgi:hypothetical protein
MAVTATLLEGPFNTPEGQVCVFNVPLKAAWTGAGETLDLTDWFDEITQADIQTVTSANALALSLNLVLPAPGVTITATNVSVVAKRDRGVDSGAGGFDNLDTVDLSGVVLSRLVVKGKRVVDDAWA